MAVIIRENDVCVGELTMLGAARLDLALGYAGKLRAMINPVQIANYAPGFSPEVLRALEIIERALEAAREMC
jgi:hypothetical protein